MLVLLLTLVPCNDCPRLLETIVWCVNFASLEESTCEKHLVDRLYYLLTSECLAASMPTKLCNADSSAKFSAATRKLLVSASGMTVLARGQGTN